MARMDIYHYTLIQTHECITSTVHSKVNCGPQLIMMCQCGFILGIKFTILVSNTDIRRGSYASMGVDGTWEISVPPFQFCCKHKIKRQSLKMPPPHPKNVSFYNLQLLYHIFIQIFPTLVNICFYFCV